MRFLKRARTLVGLSGTVSLLLTTDAEMRRLNRTFRGKSKPTDVLSFPADTIPGLPPEQQHSGDLAISLEIAAGQATQFGHTLEQELKILVLHGLLHLTGLDHESDGGEMAARELDLRSRLRLPSGLIDRTLGARPVRSPAAPAKSSTVRRQRAPAKSRTRLAAR